MYDGGRRGLPMYDVQRTMYDCDYSALCAGIFAKQVRTGCRETVRGRDYKGAGIFAKQVRTRVDEAVREVWRRFRGCFSCWVVLQSDRRCSNPAEKENE